MPQTRIRILDTAIVLHEQAAHLAAQGRLGDASTTYQQIAALYEVGGYQGFAGSARLLAALHREPA